MTADGAVIMLVDKHRRWRQDSARALEAAGFAVRQVESYELPPDLSVDRDDAQTIVVLGCPRVGEDELEFLQHALERGLHVVVLASSVPWRVMRLLFLTGADDVTEKPHDEPSRLVQIVSDVRESIISRRVVPEHPRGQREI